MKTEEASGQTHVQVLTPPSPPVVLAMPDTEFEREVLERLGRLETKLDMITGDGQPGRMKLAEDRLTTLERDSIRRSAYERVINAAIALVVSAAVALHDHFGLK
jgi:hypothetical protein